MHTVAKTHLGHIPVPDVLAGKQAYYKELIFAAGSADKEMDAAQQYAKVRDAHSRAGLKKTGVVTHRNRHCGALGARVNFSEPIAEVAVAGNWRHDVLTGVYAQLGSADSVAHRAGYSSRAAAANFRQILSPLDFAETAGMVEAVFPDLQEALKSLQLVSVCKR